MNCDICGGTLSMQAGNKAVCSVCGMEYSLESLQEKIKKTNPAPNVTATSARTNNADTQLRMAEAAIRQGDYSQAVSICDTILTQDYYNYSAWKAKIRALASHSYGGNVQKAADCFAEACSLIEEKSKRDRFIADIQPVFMENVYFNEDTALIAQSFVLVDVKMAESFLLKVIVEQISSCRKSYDKKIQTLQEYNREAQSDLRWCTLMGQEWNRTHFVMNQYLDNADTIWEYCGEQCSIEDCMQEFISIIKNTAQKAQKYLSSRQDIPELVNKAEKLLKKIQEKVLAEQRRAEEARKAAVKKYWENHQDMKAQLEEQRKELQQSIQTMRNSTTTSESAIKAKQLKEEINKLMHERDALGFFEFSKKREIKERIVKKNVELDDVNTRLSAEKAKVERDIQKISNKICDIDHKIENPPVKIKP